jgi:mannose-1-phosphate guanylyltransferase
LAPIAGEALLAIWLRHCRRYGIREVLLNVSQHVGLVEEFLAGGDWGVEVTLVREDEPIGTAGTVLAHREFVANTESFFILYADNLTDIALDRLAAHHAGHGKPLTMALFHAPVPSAAGIVTTRGDGLITAFEEKPLAPIGDLANAGMYVARQSLFDYIPSRAGVVDFGIDVLPRLVGLAYGCATEDLVIDIGTPAALAVASERWRKLSGERALLAGGAA